MLASALLVWSAATIVLVPSADRYKSLLLIQIAVGFAICLSAAYRDGYGFAKDALFDFRGRDTNILSVAGGVMLVPSIVILLFAGPGAARIMFVLVTVLLAVKLAYVERALLVRAAGLS